MVMYYLKLAVAISYEKQQRIRYEGCLFASRASLARNPQFGFFIADESSSHVIRLPIATTGVMYPQ